MALTKVKSGMRTLATDEVTATEIAAGAVDTAEIATDAVTANEIAAGAVAASEIASTFDISSKTVTLPAAAVTAHVTQFDDNQLKEDIALVAFQAATAGSLAKYNLVDQTVDSFSDTSGLDLGTSTNETHNTSGKYMSGVGALTKEFHTSDASWEIAGGTLIDLIIVIGSGGAGASNNDEGTNGFGGGGGGGGWYGAVDYTTPVGVSTVAVVVGAGGTKTGSDGNSGSSSSVTFGSDLTLTANGGTGGIEESAGGNGGGTSSSGTSAGSTTKLALTGGAGSAGTSSGVGTAGVAGNNGTLDSVTYYSPGGAGGGSGNVAGGVGGNGHAGSFSGGGGGAGGDSGSGPTAGGTGYGTSGGGGYHDGNEDGGAKTVDGATKYGGVGGTGTSGDSRSPYTNAGGGGLFGGGGGGGGDGGITGTGNGGDGAQGYVQLKYDAAQNMTIVSNSTTATDGAPTKGDLIVTYSTGVGSTTVGTDLKCYISRDGSAYTSSITMTAQGSTGSHNILAAHDVDLTGIASGTAMRYKIETLNQSASKDTRIHAVSLGWS